MSWLGWGRGVGELNTFGVHTPTQFHDPRPDATGCFVWLSLGRQQQSFFWLFAISTKLETVCIYIINGVVVFMCSVLLCACMYSNGDCSLKLLCYGREDETMINTEYYSGDTSGSRRSTRNLHPNCHRTTNP